MITCGIDLASQPERTAACVLEWAERRARVVELSPRDVGDDRIATLIRTSDWTGIDVAAACGLVEHCPPESRLVAAREGWIMLPLEGSLARLPGAADTME